jgi:hypothetical protein
MAPKPLERTLVRRSPVSGAMREMGQKLGYQAWVIVRYGLNHLIQLRNTSLGEALPRQKAQPRDLEIADQKLP